jgi:hypothetical protein
MSGSNSKRHGPKRSVNFSDDKRISSTLDLNSGLRRTISACGPQTIDVKFSQKNLSNRMPMKKKSVEYP